MSYRLRADYGSGGELAEAPEHYGDDPDAVFEVPTYEGDDVPSYMLGSSGHLADDVRYGPDDGQYIPDDAQYIPDDAQYIPDDSQYLPDDAQYAPDDARYIPQAPPYEAPRFMPGAQYMVDGVQDCGVVMVHEPGTRVMVRQPETHNGMTAVASASSSAPPASSQPPLKPALGHIDFWPSCQTPATRASDTTFETFDILVERANRWMQQFTDFELICCETVDKKVKLVQDIYSASMCYRDPDNQTPPACHIKGFRLWYRQRCNRSSTPIVLNFMDFMPRYLNPGEKEPRFENLSQVLEKANERIKQYPIQGSVISVETVVLKIPAAEWSGQLRINPRICQSFDEYFTHQITFLRIFYKVLEEYTPECIGVKDFPPDTLAEGGLFSPAQYSPLPSLIEKARVWITQSRGIRICTLQTLETKHRKKSEGMRFNTGEMFEYKIEDRFRAYFLRVGYVRPMDSSMCLASYPPPDVAHRTFVPYYKSDAYENITELLERANACINCTGANPIYTESIPIPEWMVRWEFCEKGDRTFFDGEWFFVSDKEGNQKGPYRHPLVYAIRVYFDGDFQDPPFMRTESIQAPSKSCCRVM